MDKIIATDLDGTLFYPKKRVSMIPKDNVRFLRRFVGDGGRLVLVSSRADNFPPKIAKHLDVPFDFVGVDGAMIVIDGKVKERSFFDPETLRNIVMEIKHNYHPWIFMLTSKDHPLILAKSGVKKIVSSIYLLYMFAQGAYREEGIKSDHLFFSEIEKGEAYKLMLFIGFTKKHKLLAKRLTEEINEKYPTVEAHWLNEVVEITPKGCTKASGLSKYLDYLHANPDNIWVIGDGGNDVPMFERYPLHSYAMEHAHPSIKSKASKTVRRFSDLEKELYPSADRKNREKKK